MSSYSQSIEKLLELLAFLIHLSSGLPARSNELLTLRHRNTAAGGIRNIFLDQGLVMLVTGIHKGFSRSERLKVIHRFLPQEVSTLLVYYLWLILPFWEAMQANFDPSSQGSFSPFLWKTSGLDGDEGSSKKRWGKLAGIESLTISSWRHIAIALGRRYIRDAAITSQGLYSEVDHGDSESSSDEEGPGERDTILHRQTGHGSMTSNLVYGRQLTEAHFETYQRRQSFRLLSEEWHFLLGFPSAPGFSRATIPSGSKRGLAAVDLEHFQQLQAARWKQLRKVDLDLELQRLLGSNATFRQGQKPILEAIMAQKSPVSRLPSPPAKSPKPPPPSFTEVDSLRKQAEPYRLAVAELPIHLLHSAWSRGNNRPLDRNHVAHLCRSFQNGGLARRAEQHYVQVSCSAAAVQKMIDAIPDADQSTAQDRRQHVLSFKNWADFNGDEKPELMAGQHRIEALKDYVKQTDSDSSDLWWICEFYDKDTLPVELDIKLRVNRRDLTLPDTHGQIWLQLASAFDRDPTLFSAEKNVNKKGIEKRMLDILCLTSEARFPISRLVTLWRSERWRPRITRWCRTSLGRTTFNISKWYQIAGYRLDDNNKPLRREDLVPAIKSLKATAYGDDWWTRLREDDDVDGADDVASWLDLRSRTLERQVLDYVRSHMTEFRDPSTKHYLDLMPEEHYEQYAERFSTGDLWMGLFHIVQHAVGPAFRPVWEDSIPERIGADDAIHQPQTEMRHRPPASAITRAICSQLGNIPEVKENPALRGVYASSELGAYIDHAVLAWASDRCRKAVESNESDEGNPWSGEALQAIQAAYQGYERILAGMTSATAISEHDDQQQQQRHLPDERISHVPNEVLRQQQGAVSSSPHLRKGLFRSTRQTGHSVTAGAQWPWKKTYYSECSSGSSGGNSASHQDILNSSHLRCRRSLDCLQPRRRH
ncbi:hypothetical protein LRP88_10850 [Fusarium phalaenopsidis]